MNPSPPSSRRKLLWAFTIGLLALAGLLFQLHAWRTLPAPRLVASSRTGTASIGARGPVMLAFGEPVQHDSVEAAFSMDPPVVGRFTWTGTAGRSIAKEQTVSFWPARPLIQGQRYTVHLASGVRGENGRKLGKAQSWQVEVRQAEAIFLSPRQAPEIWRVSSDGKSRTQLTRTGGNVYNYTVSTDGNLLAYSVKNEQQGYDLWEMSRQGDDAHLLLPCGTDWCISPAYSPDGAWIAYSRRKNSGLPGRQPDAPQIWLLERTTQATDTLVADPNVRGTEPAWSPDGRYLAFSDQLAGGVRVQNMQAQTGFLLPAEEGTGIEWSPDSLHILYTQVEVTGELPYNSVYEADVQTQQTRRLLGEAADPTDYSVPAWAPDGVWATVGWRLAGGSWSKQLWLVRLGGSQGEGQATGERQAITMEENYTHTSYQWDPGGSFLLFQRLETGGTGSPPQVAVWSRGDRRMLPLAEDAFQPQWTP